MLVFPGLRTFERERAKFSLEARSLPGFSVSTEITHTHSVNLMHCDWICLFVQRVLL